MVSRDWQPKTDSRTKRTEGDTDMCNICGRSVAWGSGWFVNRVPDLDSPSDREEMGRPYPKGDWICAECDAWCPDCGDISGGDDQE